MIALFLFYGWSSIFQDAFFPQSGINMEISQALPASLHQHKRARILMTRAPFLSAQSAKSADLPSSVFLHRLRHLPTERFARRQVLLLRLPLCHYARRRERDLAVVEVAFTMAD
ncbi:MAG TPA: hypothetical protein VM223_17860 [Planctomycetota bacterium]|nr:hypothetical protein [Planctomycetota bacterium]